MSSLNSFYWYDEKEKEKGNTCSWKLRNFSCAIELLKALFPWTLISRLRSFFAQFEDCSKGQDRFPAVIRRLEEGLGLFGIFASIARDRVKVRLGNPRDLVMLWQGRDRSSAVLAHGWINQNLCGVCWRRIGVGFRMVNRMLEWTVLLCLELRVLLCLGLGVYQLQLGLERCTPPD